ncbi:hypothetical protein Cgig2_017654 [Carnegiea gigantea]|uniref:Glycosyltransferase 61 catalytic domain-containing protein n=1 Tax=Carnegiea gigantea TaxID=171969 RepID=A0A9Q1KCM6_9CARY|nr:hypothetical protein Cgig2_017654 [Carnegiea gigantea]
MAALGLLHHDHNHHHHHHHHHHHTSNSTEFARTSFFFLLTLNLFSLFSYFLLRHSTAISGDFHHHFRYRRHSLSSSSSSSKPWPILPSYLPWSPSMAVFNSCEAFFGNGFTETADVVPRNGGGGRNGWFRCHFSRTLRSSICEGGKVRMDPEKIRMSKGGERICEVIGRGDYEELPKFKPGAFRIQVGFRNETKRWDVSPEFLERYLPKGVIDRQTMRELVGSLQFVSDSREFQCSEWVEEPTLLLTRFEYANVFHTYTDWYSAYVSSRVTSLPARPNVVFVDGHSKTQLEETWTALFSSIRFVKHFNGPVCFRHAVFVPLGYETAWFKGLTNPTDCQGASAEALWANPDDHKTARLSEFGEMIRAALGFPLNRHRASKPSSQYNVLFVRREDYLAHPRHNGSVESRLGNEQEVFDALKKWASRYRKCKMNLINGLFAHMPMKEQIRAVQDASVIIGAHGAGLTHMVSASPKTVILEIISKDYRRPHFQLISQWKGLDYHAFNLSGSYANPFEVIRRLKRIIKKIGC